MTKIWDMTQEQLQEVLNKTMKQYDGVLDEIDLNNRLKHPTSALKATETRLISRIRLINDYLD